MFYMVIIMSFKGIKLAYDTSVVYYEDTDECKKDIKKIAKNENVVCVFYKKLSEFMNVYIK